MHELTNTEIVRWWRRIGVVTPVAGKVAAATAKWRDDGFDPIVVAAAPDDDAALNRAANAARRSIHRASRR